MSQIEGSAEIHRKNTKLGGYHFDRSKKFGKKIWKSFSRRSWTFRLSREWFTVFWVPTEQENLLQ